MAQSRKRKGVKKKLQKFKQNQKRMNEQQKQGRNQIIPTPSWQSTDNIPVRGDLLEAMEHGLTNAFNGMQQAIWAFQQIIGTNLESEKNPNGLIKTKFMWDNGEEASQEDVDAYNKTMEAVRDFQEKKDKGVISNILGPTGAEIVKNPDGTIEEDRPEVKDWTEADIPKK